MMGKAPGNKRGVTLIRLNLPLSLLLQHGSRGKDDAFHAMIRKLVIEREAEASRLKVER